MGKGRQPTVSVVVPCFNAEAFIQRALESALAQKEVSWEVIAVDDGSEDGTLDVLRQFRGSVRVEECPHRGASAARNRGTKLASGRFIQYLDADDVLLPGALAARISALEEETEAVAYSDWIRIKEDGDGLVMSSETVTGRIEDAGSDPEIATFAGFWAPPAALLYRREIVERIGGWSDTLPIIQDARFLFDAARAGATFVHVPHVGAEYRMRERDGLSRNSQERFVRDVYNNALEVEAIWRAQGGLTQPRLRALYDVLDYTARSMFEMDYALFREIVRRLYEMEPRFRATWPKTAALLARILGPRAAAKLLGSLGKAPPRIVSHGG